MRVRKKVNKDNVKRLEKILKDLKGKVLKIGVFGKDDSKLLMIATVNEFGCQIKVTDKMRAYLHYHGLHLKKETEYINIPERSYIRKTFDEKKNKIDRMIQLSLKELITFQIDIDTFYNRLGTYLVSLIKETLTDVRMPPNHPYTLEQKEPRTNPLINTGRLRESITFKIE